MKIIVKNVFFIFTLLFHSLCRCFSISNTLRDEPKKFGLLNRILRGDQFDYPTNAHSVLLANQDLLYQYQGI